MSEKIVVNIDGMDIAVGGMEKLRIGIGLPMKNADSTFLNTLFARFKEWMSTFSIIIIIDPSITIDIARNNIVERAKKDNCDYLFFIDSDVLIEQGQLERLVSHCKDVISGIYHMRKSPYFQLSRKRSSEVIYTALELEGNDIIEIDGTGAGCLLIKMDVFDKIHYPWFEFKYRQICGKWEHIGEDLYFFRKLQDVGIKIYCDPAIRCIHEPIDMDTVQKYKDFRIAILKEMDRTIQELSEFVGISQSDIHDKWGIATELVAKEYKEFMNQDHKDPKDFYKTNKNYIFDLTNWHMNLRRGFDMELFRSIKEIHPSAKKILDFGSGCGQNAIILAEAGYDVSMADYEGYTFDFAKFRAKKRGLNIKYYDIEKPINDKFDIILAFDVLEHIPDEEFEKTIELLRSLRVDSGKILTSVSFGTQGGIHPMHFNSTTEKLALIEKLNE